MKVIKYVGEEMEKHDLPDGTYQGKQSGHVVELFFLDFMYEVEVDCGVRGINVPVTITISNGEIKTRLR